MGYISFHIEELQELFIQVLEFCIKYFLNSACLNIAGQVNVFGHVGVPFMTKHYGVRNINENEKCHFTFI